MVRTKEPIPRSEVRKPEWLQGTASEVWDQYAPELIQLGLLTGMDCETFSAFCVASARMRDTPDSVNAPILNQIRVLGACFGMSPAERTRFTAQAQEPKAVAVAGMR
jgi:phage terminase small subunit